MAHTFRALNRYYLLDTEGGGVFAVDEPAYILAAEKAGERVPAELGAAARKFSGEVMRGAEEELGRLVKDGLLSFSPFGRGVNGKDGASRGKPRARTGEIPPEEPPVVKALCLNVSHTCDMACAYCFAGRGEYGGGKTKLMPLRTARRAVDFLVRCSGGRRNLEIDFFGGEPLLNFAAVKETVKYARSLEKKTGKVFKFTVTTNGLNLDAEKADFINRETDNVVVSIDGRKNVHNFARACADGRLRYGDVVENARALFGGRAPDRSYYVRGTFTKNNLDFTEDVKALLAAGFDHISLEPVVLPDGHPMAITEKDVSRVTEEYDRLAEFYLSEARAGRAFDYFHFRIDLKCAPCRKKLSSGCGAGREYLAVNPSGEIYPCHQYDGRADYIMGVLGDDTTVADLDAALLRRFTPGNIERRAECGACWARYYCGGGCRANADFLSADGAPYAPACVFLKKRTELAIALYDLLDGGAADTI